MSSKKDKYLESAQKFILKGQLDRAVKDYRQIVALDPGDIRHRQRLAELLVRENCKKEAIVEFEQVGKYFSDNDYYLKAIAVYKQIQKLDPGNLGISLILASLNHKQGMTGNALNEYAGVVAAYERSGEYADALKTVEKMLEIDPENLSTLMKKGEVLFRSGARNDAFQVFSELLLYLQNSGDKTTLAKVAERVGELYPGRELFPAGQHRVASTGLTSDGLEMAAQVGDGTVQAESFDFIEAELPSENTEITTAIAADITERPEEITFSPATPAESVAPERWEEEVEIELSDDNDFEQSLAPEHTENTASSPTVEPSVPAELDFPAGDRLEFEFSFDLDAFATVDDSDAYPLPAPETSTLTAAMAEVPLAEDFNEQLDALLAEGAEPEPASTGVDDSDFADIFTILKKEAVEPLDEHDLESRYDLGIAYKEMGLYDEAINEFKVAAQGPRRIDCITLQAICFREKGLPEMAEKLLRFGIAMGGVSTVDILNLKYELAFLCETTGRLEEALIFYGEVFDINPEFHNVAQKIASLKGVDEEQDIIELEMDDLEEF